MVRLVIREAGPQARVHGSSAQDLALCDVMPGGEAAKLAIRNEYARVKRSQEEARVAIIRENVGSVPPNLPSPVAAAALQKIVRTQANIQRGSWKGRSPPPAENGKPPKVTLSPHKPPPPGLSWVRVRTNLRSPEGISDPAHYVPYLGDTDALLKSSNTLYKDLTEVNNDDNGDSFSDGGRRDDSDVEDLESTIVLRPGQRGCVFRRERAAKRVAIKNLVSMTENQNVYSIADLLADELSITVDSAVAYHANAEKRARAWAKYDSEQEFKADCKSELIAAARAEIVDPVQTELASDSLTMLFCRQCYSFDCMQHGLDTSHPKSDIHDASRIALLSEGDRKAVVDRCNSINPNRCWVVAARKARDDAGAGDGMVDLAPSAKALFGTFRQKFGDDPCRISEMIRITDYDVSSGLSCLEVGAYAASLSPLGPLKRPRNSGATTKKGRVGGSVPHKEINAMHSGMRLDYSPCNHAGQCTTKNCSCAKTGVNCEKYCACNLVRVSGESRSYTDGICSRAFRGCNCRSAAACQTNQCVCVSHRRECDPDLCRNCGAGNAPGEPRGCCNAGLRLGLRYRTVVGRSGVHGWGVYPVVEIPKGVLVGEYLGELVTQEEAERRGRVYDELQYSFLFNITENLAIDSTRMGSKLKYCNHSSEPNCEPRLMRVGGDVRVGIYSKRVIKVFEELFFDYGYGKTGPDWANKAPGKIKPPAAASNTKNALNNTINNEGSSSQHAPVASDDGDDDEPTSTPQGNALLNLGHGNGGMTRNLPPNF